MEIQLISLPGASSSPIRMVFDIDSYQRPRQTPPKVLTPGEIAAIVIFSILGVSVIIIAFLRYRTLKQRKADNRQALAPLLAHKRHLEQRRFGEVAE